MGPHQPLCVIHPLKRRHRDPPKGVLDGLRVGLGFGEQAEQASVFVFELLAGYVARSSLSMFLATERADR